MLLSIFLVLQSAPLICAKTRTWVETPPTHTHLVLSDIHSSLISSCSLGKIRITSPVLVLTTMLLPTASRTSIDSTFLFRRTNKPFAVFYTQAATDCITSKTAAKIECCRSSFRYTYKSLVLQDILNNILNDY